MEKKLIIFEISEVLLDDELGGFADVLTILGKGETAKEIEMEYQRRKYFGPWIKGMEMYANLYKGFSRKYLKKVALKYCKETFKSKARKALIELKKKGHLVGILSPIPHFIIEELGEILPLDIFEGTKFEFKEGVATGKIKRKIDRYTKIDLLKEKRKELGFRKEQLIIIGDPVSVTELPIAKEAGFFVGFDPEKESLEEVIHAAREQRNLREILNL